jgi:hypothetical protein
MNILAKLFAQCYKQETVFLFISVTLKDSSFTDYIQRPEFTDFRAKIKNGDYIGSTKTYIDAKKSSMEEAMMVTELAKRTLLH